MSFETYKPSTDYCARSEAAERAISCVKNTIQFVDINAAIINKVDLINTIQSLKNIMDSYDTDITNLNDKPALTEIDSIYL